MLTLNSGAKIHISITQSSPSDRLSFPIAAFHAQPTLPYTSLNAIAAMLLISSTHKDRSDELLRVYSSLLDKTESLALIVVLILAPYHV